MKNSITFILFFLFLSFSLNAQDYVFFSDNTSSNYYESSYGYNNSPSTLELINDVKCPVDFSHHYTGTTSLKIAYNSAENGDWGMAIAAPGWTPFDINTKDSISFYLYIDSLVAVNQLPDMFIEDINNVKTQKTALSNYISSLIPAAWNKIVVPLDYFKLNSNSADLTKIKTIYFSQNQTTNNIITLYIDELKMVNTTQNENNPPSTPKNIILKAFEKHIDLKWDLNQESDIKAYNIYKSNNGVYSLIAQVGSTENLFEQYIGSTGINISYKLSAVDSANNESQLSDSVYSTTTEMNDEQFLDMVQEATLRYFYDFGHPVSGLARERTSSGNTVTTGGSGFGIMSIVAGINRGFISREMGSERILKIVNFLSKADRFHGTWPHWMNGNTGKVIPFSTYDNGGDLVETAFMIQGLLSARHYFSQNNPVEDSIRSIITNLYNTVEWDWYSRPPYGTTLYWHWSPNYNWQINMKLIGYNETMITYILAIASPTHKINASFYKNGWASSGYYNGKTFYGYPLYVGQDFGGPLFFAHYSFLGFDPRDKKDMFTNYFVNNKNMTLINRQYCINNPESHIGYNVNCWGLTASDDPWGYSAHNPTMAGDNGTITPTAAISSMPYTPQLSIDALKNFYRSYVYKLWGIYGFKDAFNLDQNWFATDCIAIDQGPIMVMIENYRSALLWDNFMANPEIKAALDSIGFVPDTISAVNDVKEVVNDFKLLGNYPNPFNPSTTISFNLPDNEWIEVNVYSSLGEKIKTLYSGFMSAGKNSLVWNGRNEENVQVSAGVYLYTLKNKLKLLSGKMILLK